MGSRREGRLEETATEYRSLGPLTLALVVGLVLSSLGSLSVAIASVFERWMPDWELRVAAGEPLVFVAALGIGIGMGLYLLAHFSTAALFLIWIYRASKNVRALGARLRSSPAAAVYFWFVPIAHWWMPYQIVRSIYEYSAQEEERVARGDWVQKFPALFPVWWALWLFTGFARYGGWRGSASHDPEIANIGWWLEMLGTPIELLSGLTLAAIVRSISVRQKRARESDRLPS